MPEEPAAHIEESFEAIFERFQTPIYNYILRMMGNPEDASDLTQEAFLKAYQALPKLSGEVNLSAWLYRIATNTCLDELRRRRLLKWQPLETFLAAFHPKQVASDDPERETLRSEESALVQRALDRLPPKYRACLLLREYHDLSCEEIGAVIGVSRSAVKSLLFRAREEFRRVWTALEREAVAPPRGSEV
ncbi:MAG: RNA polymerase sigma factor [Chloroflexota bacterium]|nr:RNA polymerase sigma factor [Dehalococcoidia bacterium]MDW8254210.1 RNA polymerase sigma factor [Chloroflexota bacterium]